VRVSPEQVKRLRLRPPPDQAVEVEAEGSVVGGVEFILERLPSE